jgi:hypothetical protein
MLRPNYRGLWTGVRSSTLCICGFASFQRMDSSIVVSRPYEKRQSDGINSQEIFSECGLLSFALVSIPNLLQPELDRDRQVHRHGLAVQRGRLVFPLTQRVHRGLMQQRRSGDDFHRRHAAVGIDQGVDLYVA